MSRTAKPLFMLLVLSLVVTLLLAACGDPATAKPNPTTAAATTAATATTAAVTTAAITTAAPTTAAATTAAITTAAPTTTTAATATTAATTTRAATATTAASVSTTRVAGSLAFIPFTSPEGSFSISMPGTPKASVIPDNSSGQQLDLHQFLVELADVNAAYYATYLDYPATLKLNPATVLSGVRDGQVGKEGKLLSDKDIMLGQVAGKELEILRSGIYFKDRIFYINNRLYQLIVGYPDGTQTAAASSIQTFLVSFKLTAASAQTSPAPQTANLDTTEITVDPAVTAAFTQVAPSVKDLAVKMFVSDATAQDLANGLDTYFTTSGYKFAFPGETKVFQSPAGTSFAGFYTQAGAPDILMGVMAISENPTQLAANLKDLGLPGLDKLDQTKLAAQLKGHKSLTFSATGTGLGKILFSDSTASPAATTAAAVTTKPATTTTAAAIADPSEIALDPAIKAAITNLAAGVPDLDISMYVSDDQPAHLAATTEASFNKAGYKYAVPGATSFTVDNTAYSGGYSKAGSPDVAFVIGTLSDDPAKLAQNLKDFGIPGLDQADPAKLVAQFKGHKSVLLLMIGTNLGKTLSK